MTMSREQRIRLQALRDVLAERSESNGPPPTPQVLINTEVDTAHIAEAIERGSENLPTVINENHTHMDVEGMTRILTKAVNNCAATSAATEAQHKAILAAVTKLTERMADAMAGIEEMMSQLVRVVAEQKPAIYKPTLVPSSIDIAQLTAALKEQQEEWAESFKAILDRPKRQIKVEHDDGTETIIKEQ